MKILKYNLLIVSMMCCAFSVSSQSVIELNGKFGVADENGKILWEPIYDLVIPHSDQEASFFLIKKGNKYAISYKVKIDDAHWLDKKDQFWYYGEFIYDTVQFRHDGLYYYSGNFCYISLMFGQNKRYGMIDVQAHASTGGGFFPASSFKINGLGKLRSSDAIYDTIMDNQGSFYSQKLNGKYGLWNIGTGELYPAIFDEVPIKVSERKSIIKMNGKYGAIQFEENQGYEFLLPCVCREVNTIRSSKDNLKGSDPPKTIACNGQNDILVVYDPHTGTTQTPIINGLPYIIDTTKRIDFDVSFVGGRSLLYIQEHLKKNFKSDSAGLSTFLVVYDFEAKKSIYVSTLNGTLYKAFKQIDPVILTSRYDSLKRLYINEFRFIYSGQSFTRKSSKFATYYSWVVCSQENGEIFEINESFPEYLDGQKTPRKYRLKKIMYMDDVKGEFMKRFSKRKKCR